MDYLSDIADSAHYLLHDKLSIFSINERIAIWLSLVLFSLIAFCVNRFVRKNTLEPRVILDDVIASCGLACGLAVLHHGLLVFADLEQNIQVLLIMYLAIFAAGALYGRCMSNSTQSRSFKQNFLAGSHVVAGMTCWVTFHNAQEIAKACELYFSSHLGTMYFFASVYACAFAACYGLFAMYLAGKQPSNA